MPQSALSAFASSASLFTTTNTTTTTTATTEDAHNDHSTNWLFQDVFVGIANPLLVNIPGGAVFFAVKDTIQTYLQHDPYTMSKSWATVLAVLVANVPYWILRNPSEVIKTKQQAAAAIGDVRVVGAPISATTTTTTIAETTQVVTNTTTWQAFRMEFQQNGIAGFYVGYWENIVYAVPADVLKFYIYNQLWTSTAATTTTAVAAAIATTSGHSNDSTIWLAILLTWVHTLPTPSGCKFSRCHFNRRGTIWTTPLDVVRNRVMTQTIDTHNYIPLTTTIPTPIHPDTTTTTATSTNSPFGYLDTLLQIRANEGIATLFRGSIPRVGKALLSGAIQFATYEETKQQILQLLVGK